MNPWEKELIDSLRDYVETVVKKKKEEGISAVIKAMEKQLDSLDNADEVKEEMKNVSEFKAKEIFLKAIEEDPGSSSGPYHYGGNY
jgi:hypothetical protein